MIEQAPRIHRSDLRTIEPGEELTYDYQIQREDDDPPNVDEIFACRCGSAQCRGTMLWPARRKLTAKPGRRSQARPKGKSRARRR